MSRLLNLYRYANFHLDVSSSKSLALLVDKFTFRTVPTNSKVFFSEVYDYAGIVDLNKCTLMERLAYSYSKLP